MVAIIDYGMGNIASVQKALNFLKIENAVTAEQADIEKADFILLPGVGSFEQGMKHLEQKGLDKILNHEVLVKKKKFLGICLGMQLLAEHGTEPNDCKGLGWIKGTVRKIENIPFRVPHMGWNNLNILNHTYFKTLEDKDFYFIHGYHFDSEEKDVIAATVDYGESFVASIQKENIFATQFHPEKSQEAGLKLLKTFFESNA